jgi:hypothetical protein
MRGLNPENDIILFIEHLGLRLKCECHENSELFSGQKNNHDTSSEIGLKQQLGCPPW